jgi:hypothetical protein
MKGMVAAPGVSDRQSGVVAGICEMMNSNAIHPEAE